MSASARSAPTGEGDETEPTSPVHGIMQLFKLTWRRRSFFWHSADIAEYKILI